jgi:predicted transcriptional regulator
MEDERTKTMLQIIKASKEGCTKVELGRRLSLSHSLLRNITAELAHKGFLKYIGSGLYITTEDGYKFIDESASAPTDQRIQTRKAAVKKTSIKTDTMRIDGDE